MRIDIIFIIFIVGYFSISSYFGNDLCTFFFNLLQGCIYRRPFCVMCRIFKRCTITSALRSEPIAYSISPFAVIYLTGLYRKPIFIIIAKINYLMWIYTNIVYVISKLTTSMYYFIEWVIIHPLHPFFPCHFLTSADAFVKNIFFHHLRNFIWLRSKIFL